MIDKEKVKVTLSPIETKQKPKANQVGHISNTINNTNTVELTIKELAEAVAVKGQTFSASTYTGKRNLANFSSCQLVALDFDNTYKNDKRENVFSDNPITLGQMLTRCEGCGINYAFAYPSYSNSKYTNSSKLEDAVKYRICFFLDISIEDIDAAKFLYRKLFHKVFPELDEAPTPVNCFYGSNSGYLLGNGITTIDAVASKAYQLSMDNIAESSKRKTSNRLMSKVNALRNYLYKGALKMSPEQPNPYTVYKEMDVIGTLSESKPIDIEKPTFKEYLRLKNLDLPYQPTDKNGQGAMNHVVYPDTKNMEDHPLFVKNYDWEEIAKIFPPLEDLMKCSRKIEHNELFYFATNMQYIKGGIKLLRKCITNNPYIDNCKLLDPVNYTLLSKPRYAPQRTENVYPNCKSIQHGYNMLRLRHIRKRKSKSDAGFIPAIDLENPEQYYNPNELEAQKEHYMRDVYKWNRTKARKQRDVPTITIKQMQERMNRDFNNSLNSKDPNSVDVLKYVVGAGKTRMYETIGAGYIIAAPTNELKDEIYNRMIAAGNTDILKTSSLEGLSEETLAKYNAFTSAGMFKEATWFLYSLDGKELEIVKEHYKNLKACFNTNKTVVTTHAMYLNVGDKFKHHTVIIDEDITKELVKVGSFTTEDIARLELASGKNRSIEKWFYQLRQDINNASTISLFKRDTLKSIGDDRALSDIVKEHYDYVNTNILSFILQNDVWYTISEDWTKKGGVRTITYGYRRDLPIYDTIDSNGKLIIQRRKTIILSATISEYKCRKLWNDRLNFHNCPLVDHGKLSNGNHKLIQISDKAFSRTQGMKTQSNIDMINAYAEIHNATIITFASKKPLFPRADTKCHYGNTSGYDHLKGHNVIALGTWNLPSDVYLVTAAVLGVTIPPNEYQQQNLEVEVNQHLQTLYTYENLDLREIQFSYMETEMAQALGRARALREECTTLLVSNYPMLGYEQYSFDEIMIEVKANKIKQKSIKANSKSDNTPVSNGNKRKVAVQGEMPVPSVGGQV